MKLYVLRIVMQSFHHRLQAVLRAVTVEKNIIETINDQTVVLSQRAIAIIEQ